MRPPPPPALEDELGDVLEKAARHAGIGLDRLATEAGIEVGRIQDAVDYRSDLTPVELGRLAGILGLNEVGLCAIAQGAYPRPAMGGLPFCLYPLRMPFGTGVVNAYLVSAGCDETAVLFDTGASGAEIQRVWPARVRRLAAVFVTHYEAEHIGGLDETLARFGLDHFFGPPNGRWPRCRPICEGESVDVAGVRVMAWQTPGHAAEHNCYLVAKSPRAGSRELAVTGDLVFAGSLGGGYFCCRRQLHHARRVLEQLPDDALVAPGHGPLSTAGNERRFNPFLR